MHSRLKQYLSLFLVILMSLAVIPLESFHNHEEALIVCNDLTDHIEEKRFECELSDLLFPIFEYSFEDEELPKHNVVYQYQPLRVLPFIQVGQHTQFDRGPPSII